MSPQITLLPGDNHFYFYSIVATLLPAFGER